MGEKPSDNGQPFNFLDDATFKALADKEQIQYLRDAMLAIRKLREALPPEGED